MDTALAALIHFTDNASHQLRTPLAVLRTQLTLIDRSQLATHSCHANEGYGLGLAITAEIAAPFGARIDLQPGPGGTGLSA